MELISKEEAKRKIIEELDSIDHVPSWVFKRLEKAIGSLPAVEERKEGRWIEVKSTRGGHECSECHNYAPSYQSGSELLSNYCPNCGAKMKGE